MTRSITLAAALLGVLVSARFAFAADSAADALAATVMRASGSDAWPKVARLKFTFKVDRGNGQTIARAHDWDLVKNTDTVTVDGKSTTVNLAGPHDTEEAKQAFGAWTNDSYWLLAPLKVMDGGAVRSVKPDEQIEGKTYLVLHLSFGESVGMTPSDQYNLFVDPETRLVRWWDYIPAKGEPRRFSWNEYKDFNGLKLATEHRINGKIAITFADIEVVTK